MNEDGKKKYANGGFPPTGKLYIQQDSDLIVDDLVKVSKTISASTLKQKMRKIDNLLDASVVSYGTFGTFNINTFPLGMIGSNNWRKLHGLQMRRKRWMKQ